MKPSEIAAELVTFFGRLTDGDVPDATAGVCTIELAKALIAGNANVQADGKPKDEKRSDLELAALEKKERREAELAGRS